MVRKLQVVKMRARATQIGLHPYRISSAGLEIFGTPAESAAASRPTRSPTDSRLRFGIAALDEMLGDGLPQGYSVLVSGPSGSGKSLLAAAFLEEGVRNGEPGVIAVFEKRPRRARNSALDQMIARGLIAVVDNRAPDFSFEELVVRLRREIHRLGARRVVIDSLSGFELALAPPSGTIFGSRWHAWSPPWQAKASSC